ncbi:MAG TPA: outer membrane beta-barrel protein, partial [Sphingomicrobium sp.]|nr:outer membrane beta-barrel protein [Sphingomicrobium sp.]
MKKLMIATLAAAAASSPALARDGQVYLGIEGGALWAQDIDIDAHAVQEGTDVFVDDAYQLDFKTGLDLDLIAGYDFGMVRAEAELSYKRAGIDEVDGNFSEGSGSADGEVSVWSIMGNALLDFGNQDGLSFYAGGGLGWARVKLSDFDGDSIGDVDGDKDSGFAWQLIAGARYAVSSNVDLGLKYRYFQSSRLEFNGDFLPSSSFDDFEGNRFRSHSLLASL